MNLIQDKTPLLLDSTNTPRGVKKAITLERNFDRDIWVYNKKSLDELATSTAKDVKIGKAYKKRILRKKRQRSRALSSHSDSMNASAKLSARNTGM